MERQRAEVQPTPAVAEERVDARAKNVEALRQDVDEPRSHDGVEYRAAKRRAMRIREHELEPGARRCGRRQPAQHRGVASRRNWELVELERATVHDAVG